MDELPHIDEHSIDIDRPPARAWDALARVVDGSFGGTAAAYAARALGCANSGAAGARPLAAVSTVPGFHVVAADGAQLLHLEGSHRFSRYALIFRIDDLGGGRSRVRAETRAAFPGLKGEAYRTLVIRSRGHVVVTRRLLAAAKRLAERQHS